jgi:hypothetical protein
VSARSVRNAQRADLRALKELTRDYPSWTITHSDALWKAARERDGVTLTLTASAAWELGVMIVAALGPASDETGVVPAVVVTKVRPGGEPR